MKVRLSALALFLTCLPPLGGVHADTGIQLDTPLAGWHKGDPEGAHFMQQVNYPASSVNSAEDQGDSARISGLITATPKVPGMPARLIVNGISMPLKVQEDGRFDRPFVFPAGSNSVEVRSADGDQRRRLQFYNRGSGETAAKLRVVLSWDSDNTDLDLHVVTPDGGHVWYGNRSLDNGGALDVDVTTGFGPEMFASPTPLNGQYLVYVNYFGGGASSDEEGAETPAQALTVAQVTLISQEGTANEKQQSFMVPMRATGELTLVKAFNYP
ncbi:MAG: DUF2135 domain-containing protein [Pseudomonas sp.]|uniref:YfaP family protein n=1 Tax=Pseudomonas sp. TaxID=306 RepID=UPI003394BA9B